MAESVDLDLAETVRMIERVIQMIDAAWQQARSTGGPGGLVMALDEASLGLHRALIALSHSLSETAIAMAPGIPSPSCVAREPAMGRTGSGHRQLADATTRQPTLAIGRCDHAADR